PPDAWRGPRSIWLRYGFEMPAISLSLRSEIRPTWRWSRMNAPTSAHRSSRSLMGPVMPPALWPSAGPLGYRPAQRSCPRSPQQRLDRRLTALVPTCDLRLERVDLLEQGSTLGRHVG